jgi:hypothetical protein
LVVLLVVFTIRGRTFNISREDVERVLEKLDPEPLRGRAKYYIEYRGRRYRFSVDGGS